MHRNSGNLLPFLTLDALSLPFLKSLNALDLHAAFSSHYTLQRAQFNKSFNENPFILYLHQLKKLFQSFAKAFETSDKKFEGMTSDHLVHLLIALLPNEKNALRLIFEKATLLLAHTAPLNDEQTSLFLSLTTALEIKLQMLASTDETQLQDKLIVIDTPIADDIERALKKIKPSDAIIKWPAQASDVHLKIEISPSKPVTKTDQRTLAPLKHLTAACYRTEYKKIFQRKCRQPNIIEHYVALYSSLTFYDFLQKLNALGNYIAKHPEEATKLYHRKRAPLVLLFLKDHQKMVKEYASHATDIFVRKNDDLILKGLNCILALGEKEGLQLKRLPKPVLLTDAARADAQLFLKNRNENAGTGLWGWFIDLMKILKQACCCFKKEPKLEKSPPSRKVKSFIAARNPSMLMPLLRDPSLPPLSIKNLSHAQRRDSVAIPPWYQSHGGCHQGLRPDGPPTANPPLSPFPLATRFEQQLPRLQGKR